MKIAALPYFPGFYETLLGSLMDDEIEMDKEAGPSSDRYNTTAAMLALSQAWVEAFNKATGLSLRFESLDSSKDYAMKGDRLFVLIFDPEDLAKLELLIGSSIFEEVLADKFTSYDGFASFYPSDPEHEVWQKPIHEWDHNQLEALLQTFVLTHVTEDPEEFKERLYYAVAESDAASEGWRVVAPRPLKEGEELVAA